MGMGERDLIPRKRRNGNMIEKWKKDMWLRWLENMKNGNETS